MVMLTIETETSECIHEKPIVLLARNNPTASDSAGRLYLTVQLKIM